MWSLINLILFLAIVIFICPQPVLQTLKKILPVILLVAAAFTLVLGIQQFISRTVTITALDQRNDDSDGSEVWLKTIRIDGEEYNPADYFSAGWITDKGVYKWRSYDAPEGGLQKTITATFKPESDIELVFDSNKWRGQVQVMYGMNCIKIDCYSQGGAGGSEYTMSIPRTELARAFSWRYILLIGLGVLILLYTYFRFFSKKQDIHSIEKKPGERYIWLDLLKVIASFFILVIHTTGSVYNVTPNRSANYIFALLANASTRCAVPIFIMISGSLLIREQTDIKKMLNKAKQAVIVLTIWNLIYIFFDYARSSQPYNLIDAIIRIPFKRGPSEHLWYGYLLVWMYLFAPIVSAMYYGMNKAVKRYFFIITIAVIGIVDILVKISLFEGIESPVKGYSIYMQVIYIAMMMLGKYIVENGDNISYKTMKSLGVTMMGLVGTIMLTTFLIKRTGKSQHTFFSEVSLSNIVYGSGLLWMFSCFRERLQQCPVAIKKCITSMSSVCLGIYYGHALLIWFFGTIHIGNMQLSLYGDTNMLIILVMCSLYFLASWGIASMVKAIPFLKKIVS